MKIPDSGYVPNDWKATVDTLVYKMRYVERPNPIILVDLPNGLNIDGERTAKDCALNPVLHMDIVQEAVNIALQTRLGNAAKMDVITVYTHSF